MSERVCGSPACNWVNRSGLTFDEYGEEALSKAFYPDRGRNFVYPAFGLCGEAGEAAEKVKKCLRDNGGVVDPESRRLIIKELGDVLWYITALADELGSSLQEVAEENLSKVRGRDARGTLGGSGDDR